MSAPVHESRTEGIAELARKTEANVDALIKGAFDSGAQSALLESIRLLKLNGLHRAADTLLENHERLLAASHARFAANAAIFKAREVTA